MERTDLRLDSAEILANDYFKKVGTGKGTGYKQYQRWLYERRFHLDSKGDYILPTVENASYQNFIRNQKKNKANPITWTEVGPKSWSYSGNWNPGVGRVNSIAIHPSDTTKIYIATPGGGIWKSTNSGSSWSPLLDDVNFSWMSFFHISIDPSNQSTIYACLTDGGVLKSTNAGSTWSSTGSGPVSSRSVKVLPGNSNIVFAAALNGLWKSTNAGTSWTRVITGSVEDIEFNPYNSNRMYASGPGSTAIWLSTNGGSSWTARGSSAGVVGTGRTLIAVSSSNPSIVYAVQANGSLFGYLYQSTDSGSTYSVKVTGNPTNGTNYFGYETNGTGTTGQASYDMAIAVNPLVSSEVFISGIITWKSTNSGASFTPLVDWLYPNGIGYHHADLHALEWVKSTLYSGSDGGIYKSTNRGSSWTDLSSGLGIAQVYRISCAKTNSNMLTLGCQDNGTSFRQSNGAWKDWVGADGMDNIISPTDANFAIATSQNGDIYRTTNAGSNRTNLNKPAVGSWVTPLVMHPTNHDTIYGGWTGVYRSDNQGTSWTNISGSAITTTLDALAVAPSNTKYIYASDGNKLYRTKNGGTSWSNVTVAAAITSIAVSPYDPEKIWITCNHTTYRVFVSTNFGSSFTDISSGLPNVSARSIVVDDNSWEGLYLGLNIGVYYRNNITNTWVAHGSNLPLVSVNEVEIQKSGGKLRVATYGRGIWESSLQTVSTCPVVSGNTVSSITKTSATVSWSSATGGVSYRIQVKPASSSTWNFTANTTGTSVTFNSLTAGTLYDYRIITFCSSDSSNYAQSTFTTNYNCTSPGSLSATSITSNSSVLNWGAVSGATGYVVEYQASGSSNWIRLSSTTSVFATLTGLSGGTSYNWRVKTICTNDSSSFVQSNFSTLLCSDPNGLSTSNTSTTSLTLNWSSNGAATNYTVEYKQASSSTWGGTSSISGTYRNLSGLNPGTLYDWRVRANCTGGNSGYTQSTFTTSCYTPYNLSISNLKPDSVTLLWSSASGAINYTVEYKLSSSSTWINAGNTNSNSFDLSGLAAGYTYNWRVRVNCTSNSGSFVQSSFTTPCTEIKGLQVSSIGTGSAVLSWSPSAYSVGYNINYKASSSSTWNGSINVSNSYYSLSGLSSGVSYDFIVKTRCSANNSNYTQISFTTNSSCSSPSSLSISNLTSGSVTLSWGSVSGANNYTIQYKPSTSSTWSSAISTSSTNYTLSGLSAGTNYDWQVRSNCSTGISSYSQSTFGTTCNTPANPSVSGLGTTGVTLNWSAASGTTDYTINVKEASSSGWTSSYTTTGLSLILNNLTPGLTYDWRVKSNCSSFGSGYLQSSFSTVCSNPSNLKVGNLTSGGAVVSWNRSSGASTYTFQYKEASSSTWSSAVSQADSQYILTGLTGGTKYHWRVRTNCSASSGSYQSDSFITICNVPGNLSVSNLTSSTALLSWNSVAGANDYSLSFKEKNSSSWSGPLSISGTTYTLTGLKAGTDYDWQLKSNCISVGSANVFSGFSTLCPSPFNPVVINKSDSSVTLSWSALQHSKDFDFQYKPASSSTWSGIINVNDTLITLNSLSSGILYDWRVRNNCTSSQSTFLISTFVTTCPSASGLSESNITDTSALLNWISSSGSVSYILEYQRTGSSGWTRINTGNQTSYLLAGLTTSTTYDWSVRAICSSDSSNKTTSSFSTNSNCSAPASLSVSNLNVTTATISWSAVSGASGYTYEYRVAGTGSWVGTNTTTGSLVNLSGLSPGTNYEWRVKTNCSSSSSVFNSSVFTTTCPVPSGLKSVSVKVDTVAVTWNAVAGASGYTLETKLTSSSVWDSAGTTSSNSYTFTGLYGGYTYNWRVKTNCNSTESSYSSSSFTTNCGLPSDLQVSNIGQNSAYLSWTEPASVIKFTIEYKVAGTSTWTGTKNISFDYYNLTGLSPGTTYDWRVRSRCAANNSGYVQSNFTTTSNCQAPSNLRSLKLTGDTAILAWSPVSGASGYTYEFKPNSSSSWSGANNASDTVITLTGLVSGTLYDWRVKTTCSGLSSGNTSGSFVTLCKSPLHLTNVSQGTDSAYVQWNSALTGSTYTIEYKPSSSSNWIGTTSTSDTFYIFKGLNPGVQYNWRVRTNCSSANSSFIQSLFTTKIICDPPLNLAETKIGSDSAALYWSSVNGAGGYTVEYKKGTSSGWNTYGVVTDTVLILNGLTPGTNYMWRVKSNCSSISSSYSQSNFTTLCTTPQNLAVTYIGTDEVNIKWDSIPGTGNYKIEYKLNSSGSWDSVFSSSNDYLLTGLKTGHSYFWRVKNVCADVSSSFSMETFTTNCAIPQNPESLFVNKDSAVLAWNAVPYSNGYVFEYKLQSSSSWISAGNQSDTIFYLGGLNAGTSYNWRVKTICVSNNSSTVQSSFTTWSVCNPPQNLMANNIGTSGASLLWNKVGSYGNYEVRYRSAGSGTWSGISSTSDTTLSLTGLTPGTKYYWEVRTDCGSLKSNFSTDSFSTACNTPTNLTESNVKPDSVTLSWSSVSGASNYYLDYKLNTSGTWISLSSGSGTTWQLNGLGGGLTYDWRVKTNCTNAVYATSSFTTPCESPSNLTVSNLTTTSAVIAWQGVNSNIGYQFEYKLNSSSTWTNTTNTSFTSYSLNSLSQGKTYDWRVKTRCAANNSIFVYGSFSTVNTCIAPANLSSAGITQNSAGLKWNSVSSGTSYLIEYKEISASGWTTASTVTDTVYTLTGLNPGIDYYWRVTTNCSGSSSGTSQASFSTTCGNPNNLNETNLNSDSVVLNWSVVTGASIYTIEYKLSSSSGWSYAGTTNTNSYILRNLNGGYTYNWRVKTNCYGASFANSSFTTPCKIPENLVTTNISTTSGLLNWDNVSSTVGYVVEYKVSSSSTWSGSINVSNNYYFLTGLSSGVNYDWRVKSRCSANNSSYINSNFTTNSSCAAPSNLLVSNTGTDTVILSWSTSSGAINYTVEYKPSGSSGWTSAGTTNATGITLRNLSPGVFYVWQVRSNCSGGNSSFTSSSFTTNCVIPASLTVSNVSNNSAIVNWNAVSGAIGYVLQYKTSSASGWNPAINVSGTNYTLTGLNSGTNYDWKVRTTCTSLNSNFSQSSFTTNSPTSCTTPVGLSSSNITSNSAQISWNPVSGASSYTTEYKLASSGTWTGSNTSGSTSVTITGLLAGVTYNWRVTTNCGSSSSISASSSFTTPCKEPGQLTTSNITANSATISWTPAPNTVNHTYQYKEMGSSTWIATTNTSFSTIYLNGLKAGVTYIWEVRSRCAANNSVYLADTFTTDCKAPSNLKVTGSTHNSVSLVWNMVSNATSYQVEYKDKSSSTWLGSSVVTDTTKTYSGLSYGKYDVRVRANCGGSYGSYTNSEFIIYCLSKADSTIYEFIEKIELGSIVSQTGDNKGYYFGSTYNTNLKPGNTYSIKFKPGFPSGVWGEKWSFFIDYNQNGSFGDTLELLGRVTSTDTTTRTLSFSVPNFATLGNSRLRVNMAYGTSYIDGCSSFKYGEVEDYPVTITNAPGIKDTDPNPETAVSGSRLMVYPVPAKDIIKVEFAGVCKGTTCLILVNDIGNLIYSENVDIKNNRFSKTYDMSNSSSGVYFVLLKSEYKTISKKFIILK